MLDGTKYSSAMDLEPLTHLCVWKSKVKFTVKIDNNLSYHSRERLITYLTVLDFFITDKPCIPEGPLIVEALLKSSVVISWKVPKDDGGSMISNYIVEKCEAKEGEKWHLVSSSISGTTCRVPNLTESAGYYFRVSAQNQYGVSEPLEIPSVVIIKSPFGKSVHISLFYFFTSKRNKTTVI